MSPKVTNPGKMTSSLSKREKILPNVVSRWRQSFQFPRQF